MKPYITAVSVFAIDQISKILVRMLLETGMHYPVIPSLFGLTRHENTGVAFGLLSRVPKQLLFIIFVLAAATAGTFLLRFYMKLPEDSKMARTALMLLAGGAAGNFTDRIIFGKVTDFLDIARFEPYYKNFWPIFNLADVAILTGTLLLLITILLRQNSASGTSLQSGDK